MSGEPQLIDGGAARTGARPGIDDGNHDTPHRADGLPRRQNRPRAEGRQAHRWRRLLPTWRMAPRRLLLIVLLRRAGSSPATNWSTSPGERERDRAEQRLPVLRRLPSSPGTARSTARTSASARCPKRPARGLAAEDRNFYQSPPSTRRRWSARRWNTVTGKGKQSGSTITQQYVKNYYLDQEQTVTRKAKEFFIAIKLDREMSKDEILEGYLNTSYFGRNAYGIQAAAQAYYGKDVDELDAAEGAYLATLLNAPSAYDIVAHPQNKAQARARWDYVLDGMVKEGWLTGGDAPR